MTVAIEMLAPMAEKIITRYFTDSDPYNSICDYL